MNNQQTVKELESNVLALLEGSYCSYRLKDENNQKELESKVLALLEGPLKHRGEYQKEKCIKSFCELLRYLEKILLYERGIHYTQYNYADPNYLTTYKEKHEEVVRILRNEMSRQFRHFITFL